MASLGSGARHGGVSVVSTTNKARLFSLQRSLVYPLKYACHIVAFRSCCVDKMTLWFHDLIFYYRRIQCKACTGLLFDGAVVRLLAKDNSMENETWPSAVPIGPFN